MVEDAQLVVRRYAGGVEIWIDLVVGEAAAVLVCGDTLRKGNLPVAFTDQIEIGERHCGVLCSESVGCMSSVTVVVRWLRHCGSLGTMF